MRRTEAAGRGPRSHMSPANLSKFQGGKCLAEHRHDRRVRRRSKEQQVKTDLRVRDGLGCRWPGCELWKQGFRVEGVHLRDKGMGGDPKLLRTQRDLMIRLCFQHHQGPVSIHSGHLDIQFLTDRNTDGPCSFLMRQSVDAIWVVVGVEDEFTFSVRRNPAAEESDDQEGEE